MVKVDKNLCIGCGTCASACPDVFEMNEDQKSQIKKDADLKKNEKCIEEAMEQCPVDAIDK